MSALAKPMLGIEEKILINEVLSSGKLAQGQYDNHTFLIYCNCKCPHNCRKGSFNTRSSEISRAGG